MSAVGMAAAPSVAIEERRRKGRSTIATSAGLLAAMAVLSLSVGATGVSLDVLPSVVADLFAGSGADTERERLILLEIRLPRTLLAMFVGSSLAVSGAMMQGLFRNPLADPGVIGVSAGAALAAVCVIALGHGMAAPLVGLLGIYAVPVAAFLGGMVATLVLVAIAARHGQLMVGTLLLAGIAIAALAQAFLGLIAFVSDDRALRDLTLWTLGSLAGASWAKVLGIAPFAVLLLLLVPRLVRGLNGFLFGEAEAFHLGIEVEKTKRLVVVATAASVGAAVAVAGIIGFLGIVIPNFVRLLTGPDHAYVLPASALLGASLALGADVAARIAVAPAELPLGIVMAIIGAPVFLHLVLKRGAGGMG
jgi:iron complex transport system permease protein